MVPEVTQEKVTGTVLFYNTDNKGEKYIESKRVVLDGKKIDKGFNFYPNGCTRWWTMMEGLGHNIKLRFLDSTGMPLPYSAWYPAMTINSGTGNYSLFGTYVGNVAKVEARFIE